MFAQVSDLGQVTNRLVCTLDIDEMLQNFELPAPISSKSSSGFVKKEEDATEL